MCTTTTHPHQPGQIFSSWWIVRQKVAVATLCTLWPRDLRSSNADWLEKKQSTDWKVFTLNPTSPVCKKCLHICGGLRWVRNFRAQAALDTRTQQHIVFIPVALFPALIKKIRKFSSYIRKFRVEQLQSHIWPTASSYMGIYLRFSSYIRKPFLIHDFATALLWIPYIWGRFSFLFYQCGFRIGQIPFMLAIDRKRVILNTNDVAWNFDRCKRGPSSATPQDYANFYLLWTHLFSYAICIWVFLLIRIRIPSDPKLFRPRSVWDRLRPSLHETGINF